MEMRAPCSDTSIQHCSSQCFFALLFPKIPNQILRLPAGFYANHKWYDCQADKHTITQSGVGGKNQQKPAPITQGHLITPWKKSKQPFVMISLNALITPGDNSIMIVAIKWGFHQDPQTEGGKAIIPPILRYDVAFNIVLLGHLAEFMTLHNACGEFPRWQQQTL